MNKEEYAKKINKIKLSILKKASENFVNFMNLSDMNKLEYIKKNQRLNKFVENKITDLKLIRLGEANFMIGDEVIVKKYNEEYARGKIKYVDVKDDGEIIYVIHKILKNGNLSKNPIGHSMFQYFFLEKDMEKIESEN